MTRPGGRWDRLLLWAYPRAWRARYGEEFLALWADERADRGHDVRDALDVLRTGLAARLRVRGRALVPPALAAGVLLGLTAWSQLVVGWRWEPPGSTAVAVAFGLTSVALIALLLVSVLAILPMALAVGKSLQDSVTRRRVLPPLLVGAVAAAVFALGCRHFAAQWPGSGGHPWRGHGLVPAHPAALVWSATRGVTTYWLHPSALARFSSGEIAWMAASPVLFAVTVGCVLRAAKASRMSSRTERHELRMLRAATLAFVVLLTGVAFWVVTDVAPGPTGIYRVGMVDRVAMVAMIGLLAVVLRVIDRGETRDRIPS